MDITGKIIDVLPEESGTSKAGNAWKKHGYILETFDTYPKKVKLTVFGRNCDNVRMEAGRTYTVSFDLDSHEFNGRWYTDVMCYAAREAQEPTNFGNPGQATPAAPQQAAPAPAAPAFPQSDPFGAPAPGGAAGAAAFGDSSDDLPF